MRRVRLMSFSRSHLGGVTVGAVGTTSTVGPRLLVAGAEIYQQNDTTLRIKIIMHAGEGLVQALAPIFWLPSCRAFDTSTIEDE